ncbi:PAS domain-containing protein [Methanoplanus limicola]|uniref:PAS fold-4 domain protein n=1 Tax=Methanoplanus limicola DSM 2279 TaxID=937775 RepID=H1YYQ0_9EURY|nr:PAS domain-containing protein [Methanoplanus limicola]EHQ36033.1 PAS fold-4 domain protein [Methanoplanus limicola DSM 2279]
MEGETGLKIEDYRKENAELRKTMLLYKSILDAIPFPVSVTDMDMKWIYMNPATAMIADMDPGESIGLHCSNWSTSLCNTEHCAFKQLHSGKNEAYLDHTDKKYKCNMAYVQDNEGHNIGMMEIIQDISDVAEISDYLDNEFAKLRENLDRFASGNFDLEFDVADADEYTVDIREQVIKINESFDRARDAVKLLVEDAGMLAKAGVEGRLDTRADASRHEGEFAGIVAGVNDTLDAVIGPLNIAAEYIERISRGDIPAKITGEYYGDFNEIKNNLNMCIDGLGGLVEADKILQNIKVNDFTEKTKGSYEGIFKELCDALNDVIDHNIYVQETVSQIADGNLERLPAYRAVGKRCDNDRLLPAYISMMSNIQLLVDETNDLTKAAVDGKLDVRADSSRLKGEYKNLIEGVNQTIDEFMGPMNIAAEYIERISRGDIPAKITGEYYGDFNEIKNNLNMCIDGLGGLVEADKILQNIKVNDFTEKTKGSYEGIFKGNMGMP